MIVTCPSCGTRYELSDAALANPRKVRCKQCRHTWQQAPIVSPFGSGSISDQEDDVVFSNLTERFAEPSGSMDDSDINIAGHVTEIQPETDFAEFRPQSSTASSSLIQKWKARFSWRLAGWAAVAGLGAILVGILILGRDRIAGRWPETTGLYALVGLSAGYPSAGLELQHVTAALDNHGEKPVLIVAGDVMNKTKATRRPVAIHIRLRDAENDLLRSWVVTPRLQGIAPQGSVPFRAELPATPKAASSEIMLGP